MCGQSAYDWNTIPTLRLFGGTLTRGGAFFRRHVDAACGVEDRSLPKCDPPLVRLLQPGDAAERRGLAATARAEQDEELAWLDFEVEVVDGRRGRLAAEALREPLNAY